METRDLKDVYSDMAKTLDAYKNCIQANNTEWQEKHKERLELMLSELPHGSGIDGTWKLDYSTDPEKHLHVFNEFHVMDENGMYDGWINFSVKIYPHLFFGIKLVITGNFGKRQDIKDYLYDVMQ